MECNRLVQAKDSLLQNIWIVDIVANPVLERRKVFVMSLEEANVGEGLLRFHLVPFKHVIGVLSQVDVQGNRVKKPSLKNRRLPEDSCIIRLPTH